MYLTLKAGVGGDWGAQFTWDFASGYYDDAFISWVPNPDLQFNFGLRKVAVAYEERFSSGNLKGLERSGATRYFVEGNNGRRLGAASYRIGAFLDGKKELNSTTNLVYTAAITDPERSETAADAAAAGDSTTNRVALWSTVGLYGKLPENGYWTTGAGVGFQLGHGNAEPLRQMAHGILKAKGLLQFDELEDIAAHAAAEAVEEPAVAIDRE